MITLKKCPFCGGEAKLSFDIADNAALGTPTMYIECVECFARPHIAYLSEENAGEQVMYIIDAWNEREGGEISQNEANGSSLYDNSRGRKDRHSFGMLLAPHGASGRTSGDQNREPDTHQF